MKLNTCILSGRCGADIEIKVINENFSVGTVNICTDESYKDRNGEWQSPANWVTVKIINQNILKFVDKIAKKGVEICIQGSVKTETWEKDGDKKSRTLIEIGFNGQIQNVVREKVGESSAPVQQATQQTPPANDSEDGDLPF